MTFHPGSIFELAHGSHPTTTLYVFDGVAIDGAVPGGPDSSLFLDNSTGDLWFTSNGIIFELAHGSQAPRPGLSELLRFLDTSPVP